jgi:hypothetical protein
MQKRKSDCGKQCVVTQKEVCNSVNAVARVCVRMCVMVYMRNVEMYKK